MDMSPPESHCGGCQCGAVRYRINGPLQHASICHCRMCQKAFGSPGAALVTVARSKLTWSRGKPSGFRSSPIVERGFCAACGTPLYMSEDGDPNYEIAIASLDDPNVIERLNSQVGVESKLRWFDSISTLPTHPTEEQRTPEDLTKLKSLQHPDHDTAKWPE